MKDEAARGVALGISVVIGKLLYSLVEQGTLDEKAATDILREAEGLVGRYSDQGQAHNAMRAVQRIRSVLENPTQPPTPQASLG